MPSTDLVCVCRPIIEVMRLHAERRSERWAGMLQETKCSPNKAKRAFAKVDIAKSGAGQAPVEDVLRELEVVGLGLSTGFIKSGYQYRYASCCKGTRTLCRKRAGCGVRLLSLERKRGRHFVERS